jgi:hypothetical protein
MAKVGEIERCDFIIRNNATFKLVLTYEDPITGAVIPLTGWDVKMQMRDLPGGSILETFTTSNGFTIDGVNGKVTLVVQPAAIQAWTFKSGWYDVVMTEPGGDKDCWLEGKFEVNTGVTL